MTTETAPKTDIEPFEINGITAKLPVSREETENESEADSPKKPRESRVFNHGTGWVTFVQACKLITASRSTLARYANEGKISFETGTKGEKLFQIVELERVFGKLKPFDTDDTSAENEESDHLAPQEPDSETILLIANLEADKRVLEAQLEAEREKTALLEKNTDDLRQAMRMLTYKPEPAAPAPTPQPEPQQQTMQEPKKGFLARLFGGGNG